MLSLKDYTHIVHYIHTTNIIIHYKVVKSSCCIDACNNDSNARLVKGKNAMEGSVQVCIDREWKSVCDDYWTHDDAKVVCRQLGFPYEGIHGIHVAVVKIVHMEYDTTQYRISPIGMLYLCVYIVTAVVNFFGHFSKGIKILPFEERFFIHPFFVKHYCCKSRCKFVFIAFLRC